MKSITALFSPTGGTAAVVRAVARGLGGQDREIDLTGPAEAETLGPDTVLLAAVPVYGGRVPAVALERLSALKGSGSPAIAAAVYGNREYEDALLELKDALEQNGFRVIAAAAFIAEHSIVRSIAAGRPDAGDLRAAQEFGASAAGKLSLPKEEQTPVQVPGNPDYKEFKGLPFHPRAGKICTGCGVCAGSCPVGAIPLEAPSKTDETKCITCMRCVAVCPAKARAVPAPALIASKTMLMTCAKTPKKPEAFL